jgi:hypothetical protein
MEHDFENKIYGTLYGKIVTQKEIPFVNKPDSKIPGMNKHYPKLQKPAQQNQLNPVSNKKQINREFFEGHTHPIIFIA